MVLAQPCVALDTACTPPPPRLGQPPRAWASHPASPESSQLHPPPTPSMQVVRDCKLPEGPQVEFTGILFQPVPW